MAGSNLLILKDQVFGFVIVGTRYRFDKAVKDSGMGEGYQNGDR